MNIKQIRDLTLKLMGIYYLSVALIYAPQLASVFSSRGKLPETSVNDLAIALSVLLPLFFWTIIGLVLTFRTTAVAKRLWSSMPEESQPYRTARRPSLRFWIVLVGFFYFVGGLGGTVSQLWIVASNSGPYAALLSDLITLALSITCIVKAATLEAYLMRKIAKNGQQTPADDVPKAAPEE